MSTYGAHHHQPRTCKRLPVNTHSPNIYHDHIGAAKLVIKERVHTEDVSSEANNNSKSTGGSIITKFGKQVKR